MEDATKRTVIPEPWAWKVEDHVYTSRCVVEALERQGYDNVPLYPLTEGPVADLVRAAREAEEYLEYAKACVRSSVRPAGDAGVLDALRAALAALEVARG